MRGVVGDPRLCGHGIRRTAAAMATAMATSSTLLDGIAADALEDVEVSELNVKEGAEILLTHLDDRFPDKTTTDHIGEALNGVFELAPRKWVLGS